MTTNRSEVVSRLWAAFGQGAQALCAHAGAAADRLAVVPKVAT